MIPCMLLCTLKRPLHVQDRKRNCSSPEQFGSCERRDAHPTVGHRRSESITLYLPSTSLSNQNLHAIPPVIHTHIHQCSPDVVAYLSLSDSCPPNPPSLSFLSLSLALSVSNPLW